MITSVVGAQWGDEGKGRIVDYLASGASAVIRYQGGDNAGHTVVNDIGKFALHIVPSGIFNKNGISIVGAGCVVNFETMEKELSAIPAEFHKNLYIDIRAHLIFPFHQDLDGAEEKGKSDKDKIGTTKRGIGPCYSDKASRIGIRAGDLLLDEKILKGKVEKLLARKNMELANFGLKEYSVADIMTLCRKWKKLFGSKITDCVPVIKKLVESGKDILLEGQLGVMRDIDWGIYPYCTSSSTTSGGAAALSGVPLNKIQRVVGVVKAYTSSVGGGPFPTELFDDDGKKLQSIGAEFGATTGRVRRVGWFDAVAVAYSAYLNGFTEIAITKLDVLDDFDEIKAAVAYKIDGKEYKTLPDTLMQEKAVPVYKTFKGWKCDITSVRKWSDLPEAAKAYVKEMEKLIAVKIKYVSVGPEREQLIVL